MKITPAALPGALILDVDRLSDERGFFARTFCTEELGALGVDTRVAQMNISYNRRQGTLRGMHFQAAPHEESKIVRCTRGRIFDVIVDIRADSPGRGRWCAVELSQDNHRALYLPVGFAHGFQTLSDDAEVLYIMGSSYRKEAAQGYRYDDPAFGIAWPMPPTVIAQRDLDYPPFGPP
jgi:dTDP-4-dehydrorhamnose 3,5-epimerase